jgi:hypothetical protein
MIDPDNPETAIRLVVAAFMAHGLLQRPDEEVEDVPLRAFQLADELIARFETPPTDFTDTVADLKSALAAEKQP